MAIGMTIAEKILARKGGRESVRPGDIVTVKAPAASEKSRLYC